MSQVRFLPDQMDDDHFYREHWEASKKLYDYFTEKGVTPYIEYGNHLGGGEYITVKADWTKFHAAYPEDKNTVKNMYGEIEKMVSDSQKIGHFLGQLEQVPGKPKTLKIQNAETIRIEDMRQFDMFLKKYIESTQTVGTPG